MAQSLGLFQVVVEDGANEIWKDPSDCRVEGSCPDKTTNPVRQPVVSTRKLGPISDVGGCNGAYCYSCRQVQTQAAGLIRAPHLDLASDVGSGSEILLRLRGTCRASNARGNI